LVGGVAEPPVTIEEAPLPVAPPLPVAARAPVFQPLSPTRYKLQITASAELREKLERLRALMRRDVPDGDLAAVIERAVTRELQRLEARRFAKTRAPRKEVNEADNAPDSRYVPTAVRRFVDQRDGSQCCYVDEQGRRCPERYDLQYHHRVTFARGGRHDPENMCLMCPSHNRYLAELEYGREKMSRYWRSNRDEAKSSQTSEGASDRSPHPEDVQRERPPLTRDALGPEQDRP
jgi:hypothetical protein